MLPVAQPPTLSRRTFMGGIGLASVGALGLTVGPPAHAATTVRSRLNSAITTLCTGHAAGVAVQDLRTMATYSYSGFWENNCASIVKPFAVLMAIRAAKRKGRWLSSYEQSMAAKAIIYSDNDACTYLWNAGGKHAGFDALSDVLNLSHTRAWYGWGWGRTWTSARDYRYFLRQMLQGTSAFTTKDRTYLLNLMARTTSSQTWGVGTVRSSKVRVEMKDGWVILSNDNLWRVNSVGHVKGEGRDYILTILTGKNRTMGAGVTRCNDISKAVYSILGAGKLQP